jgi:hypothetical protein
VPAPPGKKAKSTVNEELSHGVWRPLVTWLTAKRTRFKASSIGNPGSFATLVNAAVNGLFAPVPSSASAPGAVA